jgi:hypothetical protein
MSDKLTIYYSVENGGDGSAYPKLFDTEELAEWHQNHLDEGWGESCTGEIVVEGDNLRCSKLQTKEGYYLHLLLEYNGSEEAEEFKAEFFPDGLPEFSVKIVETNYYGIFVEDRLVHKSFAYPEKKANAAGMKKLIKRLPKSS